jgi:hypothetical protein
MEKIRYIKYRPGLLVDVCHVLMFPLLQPGRLGNPIKNLYN